MLVVWWQTLDKWVHFCCVFGEPASVFLKISYILQTGQNSQVIWSSLIVSRQRDDTCAGFLTVRKTEEIVNVWPQGILCFNHWGDLLGQQLFCLGWWWMWGNGFLSFGGSNFQADGVTPSCLLSVLRWLLCVCGAFQPHNVKPGCKSLVAEEDDTFKMLLATKGLNRPVLKHGPRSLTYVRAWWFFFESKPWSHQRMRNEGEYVGRALCQSKVRHHRPIRISSDLAKEWTVKKLSQSTSVRTRKMVNYACIGWSQRKLWWRSAAILTCKSFVKCGYRGERPIEPSSSWFPPKFPSG